MTSKTLTRLLNALAFANVGNQSDFEQMLNSFPARECDQHDPKPRPPKDKVALRIRPVMSFDVSHHALSN